MNGDATGSARHRTGGEREGDPEAFVVRFEGGAEHGRTMRGRPAILLARRVTRLGARRWVELGHRVALFRDRDASGDTSPLAAVYELASIAKRTLVYRLVGLSGG